MEKKKEKERKKKEKEKREDDDDEELGKRRTSTVGVHQMQLLPGQSLYHLITFYPQKWLYSLFENNTGRTYGLTKGWRDTTSYRDASSHLKGGPDVDPLMTITQ